MLFRTLSGPELTSELGSPNVARKRESEIKRLAKKLGVAESTIRSRKTRGQKLDAPPQIRLTKSQMQRIGRARGTTQEVAEKYGVSISTVKRLRRLYGTRRS